MMERRSSIERLFQGLLEHQAVTQHDMHIAFVDVDTFNLHGVWVDCCGRPVDLPADEVRAYEMEAQGLLAPWERAEDDGEDDDGEDDGEE